MKEKVFNYGEYLQIYTQAAVESLGFGQEVNRSSS